MPLTGPSIVAGVVHALLGGYVAFVLRRGATTSARKTLGWALGAFAVHASLLTVGYISTSEVVSTLAYVLGINAALVAVLGLYAYGRWMRQGAAIEASASPPRWLALLVGAVAATSFSGSVALRSGSFGIVLTGAVMLLLLAATHVELVRAIRTSVPTSGKMLVACMLPSIPVVLNVLMNVGVPMPWYRLTRDVLLLFFNYGVLSAYLDLGAEPIQLRERLVTGTHTFCLSAIVIATHLAFQGFDRLMGGPATRPAWDRPIALVLLVAVLGTWIAVTVVVPKLFSRSILVPIDGLVAGLGDVEEGRRVELPVVHGDEIGKVTASFNRMAATLHEHRGRLEAQIHELEQQREAVEALNEELRHQVAARSRELSDALARADLGLSRVALGDVLADRYRVEGRLGQGGMGEVYAVSRIPDGRALALKIMSGSDRSAAIRFAKEAEIGAGLHHKNLVSVVDVGLTRGMAYLVMDRIDGGSLEDARPRFGDAAWALPILAQIAEGVAALHARGIVHRDLKPANVLLSDEGGARVPKITDFGIARHRPVDALAATAAATGSAGAPSTRGTLIGTLAYMAPELSSNPPAWSPAADVFAFGLLAYETLAGTSAFTLPPLLSAFAGQPVAPPSPMPSTVPGAVEALVARCLQESPRDRPAALDVARELTLALEPGPARSAGGGTARLSP